MPLSNDIQLRQSDADKEVKLKALEDGLDKEKRQLADARQRLVEREAVVSAQTKSIQDLAEKLRAKETELRAAVDRTKSAAAAGARQADELRRVTADLERTTDDNNELRETVVRLETDATRWDAERRELERRVAEAAAAATWAAAATVQRDDDAEKRELREETRRLRDELVAHDRCSKERARLEREMKMLNETLYSSVAAKNKSVLDCRLVEDQLAAERERFAAHERQCAADRERLEADVRKLTGCPGSRRGSEDPQGRSGSRRASDDPAGVSGSRRSSEDSQGRPMDEVERQTAAAREELARLTAERDRLSNECAATGERLQAKLSRLKSLQVLRVFRMCCFYSISLTLSLFRRCSIFDLSTFLVYLKFCSTYFEPVGLKHRSQHMN